jgi:hypothetical protein
MKMTAVRHGLVIGVAALLALATPQARSQTTALMPIPGDLEESLRSNFDRNALPKGSSDATFQNGEMFRLRGDNGPALIIAPITFDTAVHRAGQNMRFDCGVFILDTRKRVHFARTTPAESTLDCMGLDAISAMPHEGARPRLLLLYQMSAHDSTDRSEIAVLTWNSLRQRYDPDWAASQSLTERLPHPTIAAARTLLATGQ